MSTEATGSPGVVLSTDIPGLPPFIRGKVRDVYDLGDHLLLVTTDRLSAFDVVLPTGIPEKGEVLNQLSAFWFRFIAGFCPNHFVSIELGDIREALRPFSTDVPDDVLRGRTMLARKLKALPVECVVRGYLEGSGWAEYKKSQSVCGIPLPAGLQQGSQLPEPIFTPSTKAHTGHDENITQETMASVIGRDLAHQVISKSLEVYSRAAAYARERGIIIADTKFEFGVEDGQVVMIDECLTPDSSRFWDAARHQPGGPQPSYDKQYVRDYLTQIGWNKEPPGPELPAEVAAATSGKYREIYRLLTRNELAA
jgi:phosphoribosylaminoimidazole-succinocarboxamide synthase